MRRCGSSPVEKDVMLSALSLNARVVSSLMLRDVSSRVGGKLIGFLFPMFMPFGHLAVLLTVYLLVGRISPLGGDLRVFFVTGILPFVMMLYPMRHTNLSILRARPLLGFPTVKILDVICGAALVEILSSTLIAVVLVVGLEMIGVDFLPSDPAIVLAGLLSALALGVSLGAFHSVITARYTGWSLVVNLSTPVFYITSGTIFFPDLLPEPLRSYASWNPLLQAIELTRVGYYGNIHSVLLMPYYAAGVALAALVLALAVERMMRRMILEF